VSKQQNVLSSEHLGREGKEPQQAYMQTEEDSNPNDLDPRALQGFEEGFEGPEGEGAPICRQ